jgi:hypothetical protein
MTVSQGEYRGYKPARAPFACRARDAGIPSGIGFTELSETIAQAQG